MESVHAFCIGLWNVPWSCDLQFASRMCDNKPALVDVDWYLSNLFTIRISFLVVVTDCHQKWWTPSDQTTSFFVLYFLYFIFVNCRKTWNVIYQIRRCWWSEKNHKQNNAPVEWKKRSSIESTFALFVLWCSRRCLYMNYRLHWRMIYHLALWLLCAETRKLPVDSTAQLFVVLFSILSAFCRWSRVCAIRCA